MIDITGTITVRQDAAAVFAYVADLRNDKHWRKEVNETRCPEAQPGTNPSEGCVMIEDSFLSKRVPHHVAALRCEEWRPNEHVIYQSLPDNPYFLKSYRTVTALGSSATRITYRIEFDEAIVKHGLGVGLPQFLVRYVAYADMKNYLKRLKSLLENA